MVFVIGALHLLTYSEVTEKIFSVTYSLQSKLKYSQREAEICRKNQTGFGWLEHYIHSDQYLEFNKTYTPAFWGSVRRQVHGDFLYPDSFDVRRVARALREAKVIRANVFRKNTSLKLKLVLEGNQTAIFKIMTL